jgi:hypothetical protein
MIEYICGACGKKFNLKGNYDRHLHRKTPCITINHMDDMALVEIKNELIEDLKCIYCNEIFTRKYNLTRHMDGRCKIKKQHNEKDKHMLEILKQQDIENKIIELQIMKHDMDEREKQFNALIDKLIKFEKVNDLKKGNNNSNNNIISTNSNNNSNNVNNISITINAHGKEDLSHLTEEDYKKIFKLCNSSVPAFIELKHFDKNHPENCNVFISNINSEYASVYNGNQWILKDKNKVIGDLYDDNCDYLIDKFNDLKHKLNVTLKANFGKFIDKHESDKTIKQMSKNIKLVLYNNRIIPLEIIKQKNNK